MTRLVACVEYDGSTFCGWQRLGHAPSVQEEVEKALSKVADIEIKVTCAGRTDSGVHAVAQIIHFDTDAKRSMKGWLLGTNTHLPDTVALCWIREVDESFHARFSAKARRYRYIILNRKARPALLNNKVAWVYYPLNELLMHEAAQALVGEHDFSSFRAAGCQARHANRELISICVSREQDFIYIDVVANAFLHHMVRNIVGALLKVGSAEWGVSAMGALLGKKDRKQAGITAPAQGLYFVHVHYPEHFGLPDQPNPPVFVA